MKRLAAATIALTLLTSPSIVLGPPRTTFSKWKEMRTGIEQRHQKVLASLHASKQTIVLLPDRVEFRRKGARKTYVSLDKTAIGGAVLDAGKKALAVFRDGSIELLRFTQKRGVISGTLRLSKKKSPKFRHALAGGHKEKYWVVFPESSEYYVIRKLEGKKWDVSKPKPYGVKVPENAVMVCSADGCEIRAGKQLITKIK